MSSDKIIETETHKAPRSSHRIWNLSLTIAAILIAWGLSICVRLDWIEISKAKPETQWGNSFLPTTHDSYLFASIIKQDSKKNQPQEKLKLHPSSKQYGPLTLLGVVCSKYAGIPAEKYVTYAPIYFAGLLAIPVVLLGRLYGSIFMGFFGACLAVVGSSYFNRTMAGYLDTDMFAVTIPAFITYFFLRAHKEESTAYLAIGAITAFIYPFFYAPGATIVTAVNLCYIGFKTANWLIKRKCISEESKCFSLSTIFLVGTSTALCGYSSGFVIASFASKFLWSCLVMVGSVGLVLWLKSKSYDFACKPLLVACLVSSIGIIGLSSPVKSIPVYVVKYYPKAKDISVYKWLFEKEQKAAESTINPAAKNIVFKNVYETIIEARGSSWPNLMERISGSSWACTLALFGYCLLVVLYPEFIIALPFIGIGIFAHWGGHRFTVHAVPIAAIGVAFLPACLLELSRRLFSYESSRVFEPITYPDEPNGFWRRFSFWYQRPFLIKHKAILISRFMTAAIVGAAIWPNLKLAHARSEILPTVLSHDEVQLLDDLHRHSKPGDYVHTWWDWGTAVWFHAERNVLTTPNNQSRDTFVFAKMMTSDSPRLTAHLARTAAEFFHHGGPLQRSGLAVDILFNYTQADPDQVLSDLEKHLPVEPTRDAYLYLPSKLIGFFHVLHMFSERNLLTGEVDPTNDFIQFSGCRMEKNAVWLSINPTNPNASVFADLSNLVFCEFNKRVNTKQIRNSSAGKQKIGWGDSETITTLQSPQGHLIHSKSLYVEGDTLSVELLDGKTGQVPISEVEWIFPSFLLGSAEHMDTNKRYSLTEKDQGDAKRLRLIFSHNSSFALLLDEAAYNSQLVQLLILNRPDPNYFELISANPSGKVYKIKK